MAQYQHLPIYKQTYDILLRTMSATKDFPREYKYTLGQKIKDELIELVVMIYRANSATDKARHIESIVERVQAIQLMMRLSHDMKILSRRHYAALSEMTDSLAKQAQGWLKSSGKGKTERV
jgi:23S rRNA-intervening sequence protein